MHTFWFETFIDESEKETKIPIHSSDNSHMVNTEGNIIELKENLSIELASDEHTNSDPRPPKHFCDKCQIVQDYRSKHCHLCGRCIRKFDHHCFWVGNG